MAKVPEFDVESSDAPPIMTDAMIDMIIDLTKENSGKLISKATARKLYEAIVQTMITETARVGQFRLPQGWGQFVLRFVPGRRRKVFGAEIDIPSKGYIRYHEGAAVKELLGRTVPADYQRKRPRPLDAAAQ